LLRNIDDKELFRSTLQDLVTAKIYLDICVEKRIVRENVTVSFENNRASSMVKTEKKGRSYYNFIINLDEKLEEYNGSSLMEIAFSRLNNDISLYYMNAGNMVYNTLLKRLYEN